MVSSPVRNPVIRVSPSAIAANMTDRCEMDLSPGSSISPRSPREGCITRSDILAQPPAKHARRVEQLLEPDAVLLFDGCFYPVEGRLVPLYHLNNVRAVQEADVPPHFRGTRRDPGEVPEPRPCKGDVVF